jgi:FkbM family methyltransferase
MLNPVRRFLKERTLTLPPGTLPRPLSLLDVGARGGMQWPWDCASRDLLDVVMVEPDPVEAARLQQQCQREGRGVVIPTALWSEATTLRLNINRSPGTSSVLRANMALLEQFPNVDRFRTDRVVELPAQTIDGLVSTGQMPSVDFAKIDVQGAELAVLQGGGDHFGGHLVGLEVEVEFCELYTGQPLFADVLAYVRTLGLEMWDIRKTYWKYERGCHVPGPPKGRAVFGDALFFRPLTGLADWLAALPRDAAKQKAAVLVMSALAYGYVDYAVAVLREPAIAKHFGAVTRAGLERGIEALGAGQCRPSREGYGHVFMIFEILSRVFRPSHGGWAALGQGLGSRRRGPFWT